MSLKLAVISFRPRRLVRYSMRSLLVLITCLCIWVAWERHQVRRQVRAIAGIEALGGQVRTSGPPPAWFERTFGFGDDAVDRVTEVHFLGPTVGDANLESLAALAQDLNHLEKLTFVETSVTDAGAERLRRRLPAVEVKLVTPVLAPPVLRSPNMPAPRPLIPNR
jgi:hypothetical protein